MAYGGHYTKWYFYIIFIVRHCYVLAEINLDSVKDIVIANKIRICSFYSEGLSASRVLDIVKNLHLSNVSARSLARVEDMHLERVANESIVYLSKVPPPEFRLSPISFTTFPLLVITEAVESWKQLLEGRVKINQMVYVVDTTTMVQYDVYTINGINLWKKIGKINGTSLRHENGVDPSLAERRMDFQGIHFNVMVASQEPFNFIPTDLDGIATYYESNDTYDVTDLVHGIFRTVLDTMAKRLNFTFNQYRRKDDWWGALYTDPSGILLVFY